MPTLSPASSSAPSAAHSSPALSAPLSALIVGAGFGGIGMAQALRKAGIEDFLIVEKGSDVGGVWRDNRYPGAACDVPSHLYSFSFEPNPDWSRKFAPQAEILDYLQKCARKYVRPGQLRLNTAVASARYDEARSLWAIHLNDGTSVEARLFISATGQLSRPVLPRIAGLEDFKGHSFHSAHWDHEIDLTDKRVAVIGTGASAIQFVPAIADRVQSLSVFQRSAAYILPRSDRAHGPREQALYRALPGAAKLYRAMLYLQYESRALAFTRFKGLLKIAGEWPFRRLLTKQVSDPARRAQLRPNYPVGCKRILLSSDYLATMARPNVALVTEGIARVTADGVETQDGQTHAADVLIYGTGFAATEFLAPMRITGRDGLQLNAAWHDGAQAYLGLSVPGFPNFFMLYGPNTNLGHNSIVYMLESQIAHVANCVQAMRREDAAAIEVDSGAYARYNSAVQRRLAHSAWHGCHSWYLDAKGRNSANWPGFTLSYRRLTGAGAQPYRLTRGDKGSGLEVLPPPGLERLAASFLRGFLRSAYRPLIGPPFSPAFQRFWAAVLGLSLPSPGRAVRERIQVQGVPVEIVRPLSGAAGKAEGAILYLHGGAFILGGPRSHRSVTTPLAASGDMAVWVADYRLAPQHAHPAAVDDAHSVYLGMLAQGLRPEQIVIAGDSAGGTLTLLLALRLRDSGEPLPAGLMTISPVVDTSFSHPDFEAKIKEDPMLRRGWLRQGASAAFGMAPPELLTADLSGLPPLYIQVGSQEVLLSDAVRLAAHAERCGVATRLEIHTERWHVFHLQSFYLKSARRAIRALADFARQRIA